MSTQMVKDVRRYDVGSVSNVELSPQGYLRCDGAITRTGVFAYRDGAGGTRRELRLPDEVFGVEALESFALAPLTNGHVADGLTPQNTGKFQVGSIINPHQDGEYVGARIQITDAQAIDDAQGGRRELSCGYSADIEITSGITSGIDGVADGLHYDAIQHNIRGNHVALVDKGRAGPDVSLRLDDADAVLILEQPPTPRAPAPKETVPMATQIKIDGVDFEVDASAAQAVTKLQSRIDEQTEAIAVAKAEIEREKARADKAEEDLAAEKKAREDAEDPKRIREAVDARLALERTVTPILGEDVKLDELGEDEIRKLVVVKTAKDGKVAKERLDGCDAAYLAARYDAAIEGYEPPAGTNEGLARGRAAGSNEGRTDAGDATAAARSAMIERNQKAGREALS